MPIGEYNLDLGRRTTMSIGTCYAEGFARLKRDKPKTPEARLLYHHMGAYFRSVLQGNTIERLYTIDQICSIVLENR